MMNAYQDLDDQSAVLALWYITNTSLSAFYKLVERFGSAKNALTQGSDVWQNSQLHISHIKRYGDASDVLSWVVHTQKQCLHDVYGMVFLGDSAYPKSLCDIYDPPPVLFFRGNSACLSDRQIAIVGSRKPSDFALDTTFNIAQYLAYHDFGVTSGLAQGVDKMAHLGALSVPKGRTVGVMGTGIDVVYPKNHNALYADILAQDGCLVTEFLPATPATKHTFPRRNRIVAGLSVATVVTEAALKSGSLITAHLTAEQGKQVFAVPSSINNSNAHGCHHLIREGATLIYHPSQILEELSPNTDIYNALPKTLTKTIHATTVHAEEMNVLTKAQEIAHVPEHLHEVFELVGNAEHDLDSLVLATKEEVGALLAKLIELEMLGVITNTGGRYAHS